MGFYPFPNYFIGNMMIFVLAAVLGYCLVERVKPSLHTPLMSLSNAMSGAQRRCQPHLSGLDPDCGARAQASSSSEACTRSRASTSGAARAGRKTWMEWVEDCDENCDDKRMNNC